MEEDSHNPLDPRLATVNHLTPMKIKAAYPQKWQDYTKFVVVRNTWDRAHSFFEFYRETNGADNYKSMTFNEWVAKDLPPPNEDHLRAIMHGEGRFDDVLDQLRYAEGVDEIIVLQDFNSQGRSKELVIFLTSFQDQVGTKLYLRNE